MVYEENVYQWIENSCIPRLFPDYENKEKRDLDYQGI